MWKEISKQRNQYMQNIAKEVEIDPLFLNYGVDKAMRRKFPPNERLPSCPGFLSLVPECIVRSPVTHGGKLAYGLWGLPKLLVEITSPNSLIQSRALHTLVEELKDECKCSRAIEEFAIGKKFSRAFSRCEPAKDILSIECLLECIGLVSTRVHGAHKILNEKDLINDMYDLIVDKKCVSRNSANALYRISTHSTAANVMIDSNHLAKVLDVLDRVDEIDDVYLLLANLIESSPKRALNYGVMETLLAKVTKDPVPAASPMKCLALLLSCKQSDEHVCPVTLVTKLYEILANDDLPLRLHEYSALALMNIIFNTEVLWKCREIWDLPLVLIKRAHSKKSDEMQLWCLQALRELIMMPSIRNFVRKTAKKQLDEIVCKKGYVQKVKTQLLQQLHRSPVSTAPIENAQ